MTLDALVMLSGALVAFLSIAGFPPSWYKPMFFILGIFVIALGIIVRRKRGQWETAQRFSARDAQADKPTQTFGDGIAAPRAHEEETLA